VQETVPDIMFTDIVMPKVDGWQLISFIRKKFTDRPFPIVAVSGTILEQLGDLEKIDADYYIAKGPMEKMKAQFNTFIDEIESEPFPASKTKKVFDVGDLYPRREAIELIESLQFQRAILESIGFGVLVLDRDASVISASRSAIAIFGVQEVDVMNRKIPALFPAEGKSVLVKTMKRIARQPNLERLTCVSKIGEHQIRCIVSLLTYEEKNIGWVLALEPEDY
jgi:PAS domain S-box-containing protein